MEYKDNRQTNRQWVYMLRNAAKNFLQRTEIKFDGMNRVARMAYHGANGMKISLSTSLDNAIDAIETGDDEGSGEGKEEKSVK